MPYVNEMKQSKFIKKEDVGDGALVTIKEVVQMNVAIEGAEEDLKWCIIFNESEKPMVLNSTNAHLIEKITEPNGELSVAVYVGNALYSYFPFNQQTVKTAIDYVKGLKTPPKVEVIHEELIP